MNWYGFFIALGILIGVLVVEKVNKELRIIKLSNCEFSFFDVLLWLLIPGIIGARLYHVIDYWYFYSENLVDILMIWKGGLGIFGGILGGVLGLWVFVWKFHLRQNLFLSLLDLGVIGLSIGQTIGRWGNYFNQELYGWSTNLPLAIYIRPENRLPGFEEFERFHPLFLYESAGCLIIFIVLCFLLRSTDSKNFSSNRTRNSPNRKNSHWRDAVNMKKENFEQFFRKKFALRVIKKPGTTFFLYLFLYSFLRFWLEFLRIEGWEIGEIRVSQILALGLVLISSFAIYRKCVKIKT